MPQILTKLWEREKKESARNRFSTEKALAILMESGNESEGDE